MNSFRVFVPGVPVAWPRAELGIMKIRGKSVPYWYVPVNAAVRVWQHDIRAAVQAVYTGPVMLGIVGLTCEFIFPRADDYRFKRKAMPRRFMGNTPDLDNLVKAVKDGLKIDKKKPERFAAIRDDRQVCHVSANKWYARHQTYEAGEPVGLYIEVRELSPEPIEFQEPEFPDYVIIEDEEEGTEPPLDPSRDQQLDEH